jgi:phosphopentomutase
MVGIHLEKPFPLYPGGFPREIIRAFETRIGRKTLGNCAASGTEIIKRLGDEHVRTGSPIVYTSADSVFQIAAHEGVIPIDEQYRICSIAREILPDIGRVIARPFIGVTGKYVRTANRKDFAVPPPPGMLLDQLAAKGAAVHAIGKISDVFLGRGIAKSDKTKSNADGMARTLAAIETTREGLIYVNLVDFDQNFGHRNDVEGYAKALEEVDAWAPTLLAAAREDLVILTADHGCDPTTPSTDHSREYVPLLVHGGKPGVNLGTRATLSDIGQTVAAVFGTSIGRGDSFLPAIV